MTALLRSSCPSDPSDVLAAVEIGLYRALVRRGESWHLRTCLGSHVNSRPVECSDPCLETQISLAWAGLVRERRGPVTGPVQASLFGEVAG